MVVEIQVVVQVFERVNTAVCSFRQECTGYGLKQALNPNVQQSRRRDTAYLDQV